MSQQKHREGVLKMFLDVKNISNVDFVTRVSLAVFYFLNKQEGKC